MQRLEVSGVVRPIYGSLGVKRLIHDLFKLDFICINLCQFNIAECKMLV